jgi:hypothetical protein
MPAIASAMRAGDEDGAVRFGTEFRDRISQDDARGSYTIIIARIPPKAAFPAKRGP